MSPSYQAIRVAAAVPIPVGHRVEVRWFSYEQSTFFSSTPEVRELAIPLIVDLDTGIEYTSGEHHNAHNSATPGRIVEVPLEVLPALKLRVKLQGVVRRCVVTVWAVDRTLTP